ncbi:MAG TPA: response regulator transcription factor [Anaerolineales bacterium]
MDLLGTGMISVAIIDDHQVLVDALQMLMSQEADLSFLGSAGTLEDGRRLIQQIPSDVILLDVDLPDGDGLDLVPFIKENSPTTQIVVLTSLSDERTLLRAIDSGISGFTSKNSSVSELLSTIRQASQGEIVVPTSLLLGLLMRLPRDKAAAYHSEKGWERLTPREYEILNGLARGKSGLVIAAELNIAPLTVRTHIRNLLAKLGVHSRLEAVAFSLRNGLIDPPT